jgi:DNA-binding LacI/PurR family transcriptional regulator
MKLARHCQTRAVELIFFCLFALSVGLISGCQSGDSSANAIDLQSLADAKEAVATPSAAPVSGAQSIGSGATKVTMLLPVSAQGVLGERGRNMRDAATLAMSDLGNNLITLSIMDTGGQDERAKKLAVDALASDSSIIIGPVELNAAKQLASASRTRRVPILALADNFAGAPGIYSVPLSEAGSAAASVAAIARSGARKFVLLLPEGAENDVVERRVANSAGNIGAALSVTLRYGPTTSSVQKVIEDLASLIESVDAIVVATGNNNPASLMASLRSSGLVKNGVRVIGTNRWEEYPLNDPIFEGVLVATIDQSEIGPIQGRFRAAYGRGADVYAGYAYDQIALSAGVASAVGPKGFTRQLMENPAGFRASTGVFRFRADGSSERSIPLYKIRNGKLELVSKSSTNF